MMFSNSTMTYMALIQAHRDFIRKTANQRYSIMYGGKRSGKTISRLQHLYMLAFAHPRTKIQVIAESLPVIKSGCLNDFKTIFAPFLHTLKENQSDKTFTFHNGSTIQFIQVDSAAKANQLGRATYRFINEANNIDKDTFDLLAISTERQVFLDFNPSASFWVDEYQTDQNIAKFNWYDNPFLAPAQQEQFRLWTEIGKQSKVGSPNYYRWQVFCEGNYCELAGEVISADNLRFRSDLPSLSSYIAFADPSNAKGGDNFALCLCGIDLNGDVWLTDSFSTNYANKSVMYDKLKEWSQRFGCQIFIEINGEVGRKFYDDCLDAGLNCQSWWSSAKKFDRIFANLDIFTHKLWVLDSEANRDYCSQFYQFSQKNKDGEGKDDNIDCLNNCFIAYIQQGRLKVLFT